MKVRGAITDVWVLKAALVVAVNRALAGARRDSAPCVRSHSRPPSAYDDDIDIYRFEPNRDYGRLWTNSYGYASREFEHERRSGTIRLALLGDSFAVGSVRQDDNFASWMERLHPGLEAYNFGVSAIGPNHYAAILQDEVLRFSPDVVLVAFFVGNDVTAPPRTKPSVTTPLLPLFL